MSEPDDTKTNGKSFDDDSDTSDVEETPEGYVSVVINSSYHGFDLSPKGRDLYQELTGKCFDDPYDVDRFDKELVYVVKKLGDKSSVNTTLEVHNIPQEAIDAGAFLLKYEGNLEMVSINHEKVKLWKSENAAKAIQSKMFALVQFLHSNHPYIFGECNFSEDEYQKALEHAATKISPP